MFTINRISRCVKRECAREAHSGEIVAIAGVAGNGQVEIADAIAGLVPVRSGRSLLNGRDITKLSYQGTERPKEFPIFPRIQNYGLVMDFTLSENLALVLLQRAVLSYKEYWIRRFLKTTGKN